MSPRRKVLSKRPNPYKKATYKEAMQRRVQVEEWMSDGYPRRDIVRKAGEAWGIGESQTEHYIADVRKVWLDTFKKDLEHAAPEAIETRYKMILRAQSKGDIATAGRIRDSLDKIRGVYVDRVHTTTEEQPMDLSALTDEELRVLAAIQKKCQRPQDGQIVKG